MTEEEAKEFYRTKEMLKLSRNKVVRLEKKLDIAVKALKEYASDKNYDFMDEINFTISLKENGQNNVFGSIEFAKHTLEQIKGVK